VVIVAVPVPEQFGVTIDQRPDGVLVVWFSKPSQNTALAGQDPPLGGLEGELDGELDGELEGELEGELDGELGGELGGVLGVPIPLHATPLNANPIGAPFVPENVAWNPKPTVAPAATAPL
jgi:hypothetical protein